MCTRACADGANMDRANSDPDGEEVTKTQLDVIATLQPSLLDKIAEVCPSEGSLHVA